MMISPTLDTAEREMVKPIEAVAKAIYEDRNGRGCVPWSRYQHKIPYRKDAVAALDYLTSHGFLTLDAIVAIQAEKKGAGE